MRQLTEETFAELYPRVAAWSSTGVLPTADPARFEPFAVALAKTLDGLAMDEPRAREQRRRWDGLTGHLRKIIRRISPEGSLQPFGSTVTGLALEGADLDLCLHLPNLSGRKATEQVLRRIRGALDHDGMRDVTVIGHAKVPIIKFVDPRSGIPVDISINNTLALHNSELIRRMLDAEPTARLMLLGLKHWCRRRDLSNAFQGTLSSYAWTILGLSHLIRTQPGSLPNLLDRTEGEGTPTSVHMSDGRILDVWIGTAPPSNEPASSLDAAHLLVGMLTSLATTVTDPDHVVTIHGSGSTTRDAKGWSSPRKSAIELLLNREDDRRGRRPRLDPHALPIEDPLDADHDLGRVLRPEGWVRILEESIRASGIIESNRKVAELFTHVTPNRTPEDRFADLRGLSTHDLRERIEQSMGDEANFQSRIKALDRALHHATRYRNAIQGKLESANLPGAIASQVEHLRSTIADATAARDRARSIGKVRTVDLSAALSKRFSELSEDQSLRTLVDLEREDRVFAEFLALQAMHSASSEADRHHGRMREAQHDLNRILSEAIPPYHDKSEDANPEPLLSRSWTPTARTIGRRVRALREAKQARRAELNHVRSARKTIEAYLHELEPRQRRGNRNPSDQRGEGRGRDRPSHRGKDGGGRGRRRKEAVPKEHRAKGGAVSIGDLMETMGQASPRQEGRSHDRKRKRTKSTARRGSAGRYQDRDRR